MTSTMRTQGPLWIAEDLLCLNIQALNFTCLPSDATHNNLPCLILLPRRPDSMQKEMRAFLLWSDKRFLLMFFFQVTCLGRTVVWTMVLVMYIMRNVPFLVRPKPSLLCLRSTRPLCHFLIIFVLVQGWTGTSSRNYPFKSSRSVVVLHALPIFRFYQNLDGRWLCFCWPYCSHSWRYLGLSFL